MKNIISYLDLKSIIIIFLFIISGILFSRYMLDGNEHKKERKSLQKENKEIEIQKKGLEKDFEKLQELYKKDSVKLVVLENQFIIIQTELDKVNIKLNQKQKQLVYWRKNWQKTKKQVEELKKNPPNRTNEELLESIREKTK